VDVAVTNILQTKLRLYGGDFSPNNVLVNVESVAGKLGQVDANLTTLAQDAITLISPSAEELPARLPAPPALNENIVIFTDVRNRQQCPTCVPIPLISQFALAQRMDAFYGEAASGQVRAEQIQSYTFADLSRFLGGLDPLLSDSELESTATPTRTGTISDSLPSDSLPITATLPLTPTATPLPTPTPLPARDEIEDALTNADWIVFAALDTDSSNQDSLALNEFLANRPDLAQSAKIVVFEFGAPYYLDTTEISKLTAYYGVFSHTPPFVDAAVGVLFQERPVFGRSPVDIPSIDYRLDDVTQPDPMQVIELFIVVNGVPETSVLDETVEGVVGDTLRLQTGVILDGNGQIVPDRTIVTFTQFDRVTGEIATIAEVPTKGGIATFDYILEDREGQRLRITASSGQAVASQEIDVSIGDNVIVLVQTATPAPTPIPTVTPMPTALPTDMPTITPSPTVALTPTPDTEGGSVQIQVADLELLLSLVAGLSVTSLLGVFMGRRWEMPAFLLVRRLLWGIIAGILTYLYIILQLPYSEQLVVLGNVGVIGATVAGGIAGMIAQWFVSLFR
jgi:beta-N-acetylhexosaminidase